MMVSRLDKWAKNLALGICTKKEAEGARWYHLFWLLIPIAGIAIFAAFVIEGSNKTDCT